MKTIEERIAELKEIAESNCDRPKPFEAGIDVGRRGLAQDAMAIIQELQAESQMRFNMHQADAEGAKVIIAELEAQLEASKKSKGNYFLKTKIESLQEENEELRKAIELIRAALISDIEEMEKVK